jgi:hypothetical protein
MPTPTPMPMPMPKKKSKHDSKDSHVKPHGSLSSFIIITHSTMREKYARVNLNHDSILL